MALFHDQNILISIKKLLNISEDDPAFDTDIRMFINNELMTIKQLGIGVKEDFYEIDDNSVWADFSDDKSILETTKVLIFLKVKMLFDPPASSVVADAINQRIRELEWRLNVQAERDYHYLLDSQNT